MLAKLASDGVTEQSFQGKICLVTPQKEALLGLPLLGLLEVIPGMSSQASP